MEQCSRDRPVLVQLVLSCRDGASATFECVGESLYFGLEALPRVWCVVGRRNALLLLNRV